jgi:hypothetical protein
MLPKSPIPFAATPQLVVQYCTMHLGKVKCVADPEGRGRVQVEVPGLLGTGKENWTDWIEVTGTPTGGTKAEGDEGIWWPLQVGQIVLVGFISGDPFALYCLPGPTVQDGKGRNKQWAPKEAKKAGKDNPRDATRVRQWKSESGHTLLYDDRGKKEKLSLIDWAGAGLFLVGPGKTEDEEEKEGEESKPRKGERRGMRLVATGTSKTVGELIEGAKYMLGLLDLNGQGVITTAEDGAGKVAFYAATKNGEVGPSLLIDAKANRIYVTCGAVQMVWRGDKGDIQATRILIQELAEKYPVENWITDMRQGLSEAFEEFKES